MVICYRDCSTLPSWPCSGAEAPSCYRTSLEPFLLTVCNDSLNTKTPSLALGRRFAMAPPRRLAILRSGSNIWQRRKFDRKILSREAGNL